MKDQRKKILKKAKRVVVKVGSAVVAGGIAGGATVFERLAGEVHSLKAGGREFVIVSSGAVALGMQKLDIARRPATIPERQAIAAVGQGALMSRYEAAFAKHGEKVAQVLLTHDDISNRKRFLNARNTLFTLLDFGITPVINENDTVSVDEIKFGDNDKLSALTTSLVEADLLVILTKHDGLFDNDPETGKGARRIPLVSDVDAIDSAWLKTSTSSLGTGGIISKCEAARTAAHFGVPTVVASGFTVGILSKVLDAEEEGIAPSVGTLFLPKADRLTSKKHWIAFSTRPSGRVFVDEGAKEALLKKGRSLLPSGIKEVDGTFDAGEVVHCVDSKGMEFARGVVNYSSAEISKIKGIKTTEVEKTLGYKIYDEVIHRDNLVVL